MRPSGELKHSRLCAILTEDSDRIETIESLATLALLLDARDTKTSKKAADQLAEKLRTSINEKKKRLQERIGMLTSPHTVVEHRTVGVLEGRLLVSEHKSRLCEILRDTNRLECKNFADQKSQNKFLKTAEEKSNGHLKRCKSDSNKEVKLFKDSVSQTNKCRALKLETKPSIKDNEALSIELEKLYLSEELQVTVAEPLENEKI